MGRKKKKEESTLISDLAKETFVYTVAELHVHGILAGAVILLTKLGAGVHEEHVSILIVILSGGFVAYHFGRKRQEAKAKLAKAAKVHVVSVKPRRKRRATAKV